MLNKHLQNQGNFSKNYCTCTIVVSDGQIVKNQMLSKYHHRRKMKHFHTQVIVKMWIL